MCVNILEIKLHKAYKSGKSNAEKAGQTVAIEGSMKHRDFFDGAVIAITGSVGSVGQTLVQELLDLPIKQIILVDNNESGLYEQNVLYRKDGRTHPVLMDITDENGLVRAFSGADYVLAQP